jgi:fatty acid desaturase
MNYHIEHHLYPNVPLHALPRLHQKIKHRLPPPSKGLLRTWGEILPALARQRKDPDYHLEPVLPEAAA